MRASVLTIVFLVFLSMMVKAQIVLEKPVRFLALGDSYTIGESVETDSCWPLQLVAQMEMNGIAVDSVQIIAKTGWRTDQLIEAINQKNPQGFNLVSVLIGVNNQYQGRPIDQMKREFDCLIQEAISRAGQEKKRVFVVSIPDYAYTPFGQSKNFELISAELNAYNQYQKEQLVELGIAYFDITPISQNGLDQAELVAKDGLHPSAAQYALWVAEIMKGVR